MWQKATYLLSFDFTTNDSIFIEEGEILQNLGFNRYKGNITSNVIEIKSGEESPHWDVEILQKFAAEKSESITHPISH